MRARIVSLRPRSALALEVVVLTVALIVAGCGSSSTDTDDTSGTTVETTTTTVGTSSTDARGGDAAVAFDVVSGVVLDGYERLTDPQVLEIFEEACPVDRGHGGILDEIPSHTDEGVEMVRETTDTYDLRTVYWYESGAAAEDALTELAAKAEERVGKNCWNADDQIWHFENLSTTDSSAAWDRVMSSANGSIGEAFTRYENVIVAVFIVELTADEALNQARLTVDSLRAE